MVLKREPNGEKRKAGRSARKAERKFKGRATKKSQVRICAFQPKLLCFVTSLWDLISYYINKFERAKGNGKP